MRQVFIREVVKGSDGVVVVSGFRWHAITATGARVPKPSLVSMASEFDTAKRPTTQEQADLESGAVREERFSHEYSATTTRAQIEADLQRRWADRQAAIDAEPPTRVYWGRTWDGTSWTA